VLSVANLDWELRIIETDQRLPERENTATRMRLKFSKSVEEPCNWVFIGWNNGLSWH
jgi:hypothetical protein